ncbi:phosphoglycerate dehydrogenase [Litchfieldia salsa]|uniref:D-3-phosphoglycerate dehydrogenase n=1 Tax=Litchfieldia salsa TaxID=930152 RepID=A0A1H0VYU2_9BACI|nr:phosphoglycerate dehydrogenase [Litchfieldia salsa]SDP83632.1 D-3-phosphoglycerate dehydrogenase [Litchfieldia salsa]
MKILLMLRDTFYEANPKLIDDAKQIGHVRILYTDHGIDKEQLKNEVKDVDIIIVAVVKIDKEVIDAAPRLKYILKYGAGYDNIDVDYANRKGIPVTNAPGMNAQSAADHAFGLMLSAARNIPKKDQELKSGYWDLSMGNEIYQKKLGIIGFGSIAKAIAKRAIGFDMETLVYTNYQNSEEAEKLNVSFVDKEKLFEIADYIIIATSLNEKNRYLIDKDALSLMKSTAFIINVSRGPLIKELDLISALNNGQIKGAALDVFEIEPPINELPKMDKIIATPHIGGATYESISRIGNVSISNIKKFLNGEELDYVVIPKIPL